MGTFTYSNICQKTVGTDHLSLFMKLMKYAFRFNIQYLFIYLFKAMSTTAPQVTTCFYLLMQITC